MRETKEFEESKGKNEGFTLVELLILVIILGILATVTVLAVRGISDQGESSACNADKKTLQTAAAAYYAQNAAYPASLAVLVTEGFLQRTSSKFTYRAPVPPATNYTLTAVAGQC